MANNFNKIRIKLEEIYLGALLGFIADIGELTIFITPLTLTIGIINSIKKPKGADVGYKIMAIISAYLIVVPLINNSIF